MMKTKKNFSATNKVGAFWSNSSTVEHNWWGCIFIKEKEEKVEREAFNNLATLFEYG